MIDVEYLREAISLELKSAGYQCALEVAHPTIAALNASAQSVDTLRCETIDTATDEFRIVAGIEEACDVHSIGSADIQRFLVVDIVGYSHESVDNALGSEELESVGIHLEFVLAEDSVDRSKDERLIAEPLA